MTFAWYGHLRFKEMELSKGIGLFAIIFISWGIALFEYMFQVPANRIGFKDNGGPFSLMQLKIIQEALSITVFMFFTLFFFKTEKISWNHIIGFLLLILSVYFFFKNK
jgi:uncharacterized protein (DUF486 family)